MELDIGTAIAFVGGSAVLAGFLLQAIKKPEEKWRDEVDELKSKSLKDDSDLNIRLSEINGEVKVLVKSVEEFREKLKQHEESDDKNFDKIDEKLDKLTDLLIKIINEK